MIAEHPEVRTNGRQNRGHSYARTEWNDLERAFARRWEKENKPRACINHGNGLLQDLFFTGSGLGLFGPVCDLPLTDRDRYVAATAIQWLGSNIGFCFLQDALKAAGYKIVSTGWTPKEEPEADAEAEEIINPRLIRIRD